MKNSNRFVFSLSQIKMDRSHGEEGGTRGRFGREIPAVDSQFPTAAEILFRHCRHTIK